MKPLRHCGAFCISLILFSLSVRGQSSGGLAFDGSNDYVTFGRASPLGATAFTLEIWFKRTGTGAAANTGTGGILAVPLVAKGRGEADGNNRDMNYFLGLRAADNVLAADFEEGTGGAAPGLNHPVVGVTPVVPNVWYHAAATYDGSKWRLFLDGVLETELVVGRPPRSDSLQHASLGSALNSSGVPEGYFAGVLDEARIWNYARTPDEIVANRYQQIPSTSGLVGRWALDDTSGTTAADSSGSGINGTLINGPVWSTGAPFVPVPAVTLLSPADQGIAPGPVVFFVCNARDDIGLASATLHVGRAGVSGDFLPVETQALTGTNATSTFTIQLQDSQDYVWNCQVTNSSGQARWAAADFRLRVDANYPNYPVLIAPGDGATNVSIPAALQVEVSDPNGDSLSVNFLGRKRVPDFTVVVLPDTQYYVSSLNGGDPSMFIAQTEWIVTNQQARNVVFVTHLGDCVENGDNGGNPIEWFHATNAMYRLEDPWRTLLPEGLPYGIAVGNHDQSPLGNADGTTSFYNQYFGEPHFAGRAYYGGRYGANNDNHYELFSASGLDFVIVHLEYDTSPDAAVLAWADSLLQSYSNRRAMVVTHHLIGTGEPAAFGTQGQAIYNALKDHPNLFLMLGGHVPGEGRRQDTFGGNRVYSLLSDYQGRTQGGDGWLRLLEFSPRNNHIRVQTYSPTLNRFETDSDSQFTLDYGMLEFGGLGQSLNVPSGSTASILWTNLAYGEAYEWYATATDPSGRITQSPVWTFATAASDVFAPEITGVAAVDISDRSARLSWTTDEPADSRVEYGVEASYGSSAFDPAWVTTHTLGLTGLTPNTTYHYALRSVDAAGNASASGDFTFTTRPPNNPPVAHPQNATSQEDTALALLLTGDDPEGDPLTYAVVIGPTHGSLTGTAPNLSYTPAADYNGQDAFAFTVSDGLTSSSPATISLSLTPVNDAPVGNSQSILAPEDGAVAISLTAADAENDPLTYLVVSGPTNGTLSGTPPDLVYAPKPDYFGPDDFTFQANDGLVNGTPATVSLSVTSVNDPPFATITHPPDATFFEAPASIVLDAMANDRDGSIAKVEFFQGASRLGEATAAPYRFLWDSVGAGSYALMAVAHDDQGGTGTSAVINVTVTNPPPPAAPGDLVATALSSAQIRLDWIDRATNENAFAVERSTNGTSFVEIGTVAADGTNAVDSALSSATAYSYRVRAWNLGGYSDYSGVASVVTLPPAPVTVTFTSLAAEDGYVLESTEASNVGGSASSSSGAGGLRAGDDKTDRQFKTVLSFDTSSIPDGAAMLSARVRLKRGQVSGSNPFQTHRNCFVDIKSGNGFNNATTLTREDFQAAADADRVATLSNATANGQWSEGLLSSVGLALISSTGKTQFRVSFELDDNDDRGIDYIGWYAGEESTPENRPQLEITYE